MIERKFRDLVRTFLVGSANPTELSWVLEDLHRRRERRDVFIEEIEDFLEANRSYYENLKPLRDLLLKDLSEIKQQELERAVPRKVQAPAMEEVMAGRFKEEIEENYVSDGSSTRNSDPSREVVFEMPAGAEKDGSFALPIAGILIIVATFFFMVRFSSFQSDGGDSKDEVRALEEEISDSEAFRRASEFLGDEEVSDFSSDAGVEEEVSLESESPVSLVDLIGQDNGQSFAAGNSELFILKEPSETVSTIPVKDSP